MKYNVDVWTMIQLTLTRIVNDLEFTAMITQTSWVQNIVVDTIKEWGYKEHLHFGHTLPDVTVIQVSHNVDLLLVNAKLGQIMRIMEINIWLLETLFILSIQIFEGQYFLYEGRKLIAFHMSLQCLSMPREGSKIDFFPKKCPLDVSLRPPPEKRRYLKIPEIDFFPNIRFDMLSVVQGPQLQTGSLRMGLF